MTTLSATAEKAAQRSDERVSLEHQLVGSVMYHALGKPYLAADVLAVCPPDVFVSPKAKCVMAALRAVVTRGERVDFVTVGLEIKAQGNGKPALSGDDFARFTFAAGNAITENSVLYTARKIAEEWRKDLASVQLSLALQGVHTFGEPLDSPLAYIREAQSILDADIGMAGSDFDALLDAYGAELDKPENRYNPVPTPWYKLNRILSGGVLPGELVVLAARPSVGKTAFALNWAWSVACSGKTTVLFSLEMARQQLFDRLTSNIGNVDLGAFREGLSEGQRVHAKVAVEKMRGKPLVVIDDTRVTLGEIRRIVRIAHRKKKQIGLVVVDYLQLMTPEDRRIPREQQVAEMSRGLKLLAKDLLVPVLLLAQLNRKNEEARREPVLSDLRESVAIEQDADVVIFLHQARQAWYADEPVKTIVAKGRSSGVGREDLVFRRKVQRFEESDDQAFKSAQAEEYAANSHWSESEQDRLL